MKSDFITVNVVIQQIDDPPTFISDPLSSSNRTEKVSWNDESEYFTILEPLMQIGLFMEDRVCNLRLFYLLGLNISQKLMVQGS